MGTQWQPKKKTVELQEAAKPSRIRREPAPVENAITRKLDRIDWSSRQWEIRLAIVGIVLFALALDVIAFGFSAVLDH
jgi:hypothetical protein